MPDVLVDKQYRQYDKLSRYSTFPFYYNKVDGKYIYGTTSQLNSEVPFVNHLVKKGDTLDTLALYYYNNPTYFWIIADFNRIQDPYSDLKVDELIKIPSFSAIDFL